MADSINKTTANTASQTIDKLGEKESSLGSAISRNRSLQILEIVLVFLPVLLVVLGFRMLNSQNPMLLMGAVWVAYLLMLSLIWFSVKIRGDSWDSIGLGVERATLSSVGWILLKSLLILIFAAAAFIFGSILMANIVGIPEAADLTKYNYLRGNLPLLIISLMGVYIVSSFGEEVVFRGFLITRLQKLLGGNTKSAIFGALLLSSLVFGFAHFEWGAMGIVQTTFMGAALGIAFYLNKKGLWPLILAHCYLDTLLLVQLYLAPNPGG